MKRILTILLTFISLVTYSQTTINPDTVCVNATNQEYFVDNTIGSSYQWTINGGGGILTNGQGSNSILVNWGGNNGLFSNAVTVIETDENGCSGEPVTLDIFILDLEIEEIGPFCPGDAAQNLVGITAGGTWSGTGVNGNTFDPTISGNGVFLITYTLGECSTDILITVNEGPVTGPIQHY
jgi:hypothetical protein